LFNDTIGALRGDANRAERELMEAEYRDLVVPAEIAALLRRATTRLREYRELRETIEQMLQDGPGGTARRNVVLPRLNLQEFDGTGWENFWPLYESAIHSDTDLDGIQKMAYLDSLLKGEAKKTIQGILPYSDPNYALAIDLLRSKYGRNENLIRDLHNQLSNLPHSKNLDDDTRT
jgi:hypothetical protein